MAGNTSANPPVQVLLAGRTAALVRLTCKPGLRPALLEVLNNYVDRLDEEPGTEIYTLSIDPDNDSLVWMYEIFADEDAQVQHQQAPALGDLLPAMQELLDGPPAVLRMSPLRLSLQDTVLRDEFDSLD
ncbi:MAG: antibiotic biosynthesis monooxygenase [Candidatus Nanopelagicales bacterium]